MGLITPSTGLIFWMVLIFGIVFFILAKFGFPVITGMIGKRNEHIRQSLLDARKAKEELEGMQATCERMIESTKVEQAKILEQARKTSQQMVEDAKEEARKQAAQIISVAKAEIEVEKREAINDVRNVIVDLSVAVSEKVLRQRLEKDNAQMALVDKILDEVQNSRSDNSRS